MQSRRYLGAFSAAFLAALVAGGAAAEAAGVLTIGRREDGTTFDPIKTSQNVDYWVLSNVFDVLIRVDKTGTKLVPGLAESWTISDDGTVYTLTLRDAKFSDGSPVTAADAAFSLLRARDNPGSLIADNYKVIKTAEAKDAKTLVITLNQPAMPFLASLALPGVSVLPEKVMTAMGEDAFAEKPIGSGAFTMEEWRRGDTVVLKKNPGFWQADQVSLDGVEWISIPDDNTRMLKVQAGEIDSAIFVPFAKVAELEKDPNLVVHKDPSTREDHLLINHSHPPLDKLEVRQAIDYAINKQVIVDTVTFGIASVANSYIPKGALYHSDDNGARPYDPEKAKALLQQAGVSGVSLTYLVQTGDTVDEQVSVLIQQQLAQVGITVNLQKADPSQTWDMEVAGDYDLAMNYWTNDIIDPDQKTTFVLGYDANLNYYTRYKNDAVVALVAKARVETDPAKREAMYVDLQKMAKADAHWIDLYYSPYLTVTRKTIDGFGQNPLGRFYLEDVKKN